MRWYPLRLTISVRHYVFGGRAIPEKVGKPGMPDGRIAETWEVNDEEGGNATVIDGSLAGLTLRELTQRYPDELVAPGWRGDRFPLVTKFVDARTMLPIQARPRGGAAVAWHAVDAGHGASAYAGVKPEVSIAELREALFRGRYDSVLRRHPVRAGDSMYLPGGTLNSFGPGTLVYEVEEPGPSPTHAMSWRVTDGAAIEAAEQRANIDALLETVDIERRPHLTPGLRVTVDDGADRIFCHAGPKFVLERVRVLAGASLRCPLHGALIMTNVAPPVQIRAGLDEELVAQGSTHTSRTLALAGAAIWLGLGDYASALIDMGVALFVLAGCVALWWWREAQDAKSPQAPRWLVVATFFFGVAAGCKYQALTFLPLVAVFVLWRERRPKVLALALLSFLLPCIYWYARNAITTGDPFNPIGARLFGFTNWNAADYQNQFDDVKAHAAWPNLAIWGVVLAPLSPWFRRSAAVRAAVVFCAYSLVVWLVTSRYPRYMTASYPLVALMSALGWAVFFKAIASGVRKAAPAFAAWSRWSTVGVWVGGLLIVTLAAMSVQQTFKRGAMVSLTQDTRDAFLRVNVPGYEVMRYLREHPHGKLYQVALSEAIYYGPDEVWGDMLGPWRYADFLAAPPAEMARKFMSLGFGSLVVASPYVAGLSSKPGFDKHFVPLFEKDGAKAYRILADAP